MQTATSKQQKLAIIYDLFYTESKYFKYNDLTCEYLAHDDNTMKIKIEVTSKHGARHIEVIDYDTLINAESLELT